MCSLKSLSRVAAFAASLPLTFPWTFQRADATEPQSARTQTLAPPRLEQRTVDVKLLPGRVLVGNVVDELQQPSANADVTVSFGKQTIVRGQTNDEGCFSVELPHGGVFLVAAGSNALLVRAWTIGIAPPGAATHVILSPQATIVRGQNPAVSTVDPIFGMLLVGGIITAITVPIVLNNTDDSDHDGSGGQNPQLQAESP